MNNGNNSNKPRQINRIATPIKVDNNTNATNQVNVGNPNVQNNQVAVNQGPQGGKKVPVNKVKPPKKVKPKKEDTHDPTVMIFVMIMLLLVAVLVAFLGLYIIPEYLDNRNKERDYNDVTVTTTMPHDNVVHHYSLSNAVYINNANSFVVGDKFIINLVNNGTNFDILVNNKKITSADYLLTNVGVVDDILLFMVQNKGVRTTKLYGVAANSLEVVLEIYNLGEDIGMVLLPDNKGAVFNRATIVLLGSRINNSSLILDDSFGQVNGFNICNADILNQNNIGDNYRVTATYSFEYLGDYKFSKLELINMTDLGTYRTNNNLCK